MVATKEEFEARLEERKGQIAAAAAKISRLVAEAAAKAAECRDASAGLRDETAADIATQIAWLVFRGFAGSVPLGALESYPRYFKALATRILRARANPSGDMAKMARFEPYWEQYRKAAADASAVRNRAAFAAYRWMLEEYRVSLFAQETGTAIRVSPERLSAKWLEATGRE